MSVHLVFDLGAGSGRAILVDFDGEKISFSEIYRFSGIETRFPDGPHWDFNRLLREVEAGLGYAAHLDKKIDSIGVDSWGVDYVLMDSAGILEAFPFHYRHPRSQRGFDSLPATAAELFARTGSQILPINTIYQLHSASREDSALLQSSKHALMIADAVNYHLTGKPCCNITLARTSGLFSLEGKWDEHLLQIAGIPSHLLPHAIQTGSVIGVLKDEIRLKAQSSKPISVISVAAHDTASAVCGLPLQIGEAFLICGSWSILGREVDQAIVSPDALANGFGNEGGVGGRSIFLKSLNGLHLLQKLRAAWNSRTGQEAGFAQISAEASAANDRGATVSIDPSNKLFFDPPDLVEALKSSCPELNTPENSDLGTLALAIYRGLANEIAKALLILEKLTNEPVATLRLCGGGGQDAFLCQLIADCIGRTVSVGPIEASAWGNAIMQLISLGKIQDLAAARAVIDRSCDYAHFHPRDIGSQQTA